MTGHNTSVRLVGKRVLRISSVLQEMYRPSLPPHLLRMCLLRSDVYLREQSMGLTGFP